MTNHLTLTIERIGAFGDGIARAHEGLAFVPATAPGDVVHAKALKRTPQGLQCALIKVVTPGPGREPAACAHFPSCGGCRLQHLNTDIYKNLKRQNILDQLAYAGLEGIEVLEPVLSPPKSRRRASFSIRNSRQGFVAGFNEWHSHDVIDIGMCSVMKQELFDALQRMKPGLKAWLPINKGCDLHLTLLGRDLDAVLIGGPKLDLKSREQLAALAESCDLARISWKQWDRSPPELVSQRRQPVLEFSGSRVALPAGTFLQATAEGEKALTDLTAKATQKAEKIADLFCGIGTFALSLPHAKSIVAYDSNEEAITALSACWQAKANRRAILRDLTRLPLTPDELKGVDTVVIDPPRGGAKAQMQQLATSKVDIIVSISCDAASFTRDTKVLWDAGFRTKEIHLIDQFLWTPHIELLAVLKRA